MSEIIKALKEEEIEAVMTCFGLALVFIGVVVVFFSGFLVGNIGSVAGSFSFALGTIFIAYFRGRNDQMASGMITLGLVLAAMGIVIEMAVGLWDWNGVTKFGVFLALAGMVMLASVWVWEEKFKE